MVASEKNYENRIKSFLKNQGCWFVKYWGGGEFTKSGVPDILCCCEGQFIAIEVKAAKGKPSKLQLHNLKQIEEAGGFGILLYPDDFETFKNLILGLNTHDPYAFLHHEFFKRRLRENE